MVDIARPIIICAASRSGSSLTAGIFAGHGCWVGRCRPGDQHNPKGYFENLDVKKKIKQEYWLKGKRNTDSFTEWVKNLLENSDYKGGPWLVKHGAPAYWLWEQFDPIYISVRRTWEASQKSRENALMPMNEQVRDRHDKAFKELEKLGSKEIWPEKFKDGDFSELKDAIEHCDLGYNQEVVDNFYDAKHWHY